MGQGCPISLHIELRHRARDMKFCALGCRPHVSPNSVLFHKTGASLLQKHLLIQYDTIGNDFQPTAHTHTHTHTQGQTEDPYLISPASAGRGWAQKLQCPGNITRTSCIRSTHTEHVALHYQTLDALIAEICSLVIQTQSGR
jgi:hypothetical protein